MGYRLIADAAMLAHFVFLVYLVAGGFLAWRWRRTIWVHLAVAAWGLGSVVIGYDCPLTHVENWGRERAGDEKLPTTGFIDHYLTGVIYPADHVWVAQLAVAVVVIVSWIGFVVRGSRLRSTSEKTRSTGEKTRSTSEKTRSTSAKGRSTR